MKFPLSDQLDLSELRKAIDDIDKKIVEHINARAQLAKLIATIKSEQQQSIKVKSREDIVLNHISKINETAGAHFPEDTLKEIYQRIIAGCRAIQKDQL